MPSRRRVLAAGCLALAGRAGCLGGSDSIPGDGNTDGTTSDNTSANDGSSRYDPGDFRITVADGDGEVELATGADVAVVGEVTSSERVDGYLVPLKLTDEGTDAFTDGLERAGALGDPDAHQIRSYLDGKLVHEATLGLNLARAIETGEWSGSLAVQVSDRDVAEELQGALESA